MHWDDTVDRAFLWEACVDSMGIYPRAVTKGDVTELRTPWQDGWNAALMGITRRRDRLIAWWRSLDQAGRALLADALTDEWLRVVFPENEAAPLEFRIDCGDTFAYACADSEDVAVASLPEVARLYQKHGYCGLVAWIAMKRRVDPVREYRYDASYLAAVADLTPDDCIDPPGMPAPLLGHPDGS